MRTTVAVIALLLAVVCAAATEDGRPLVLVTGTAIEVSRAELREGMVWVTTANGVMQAYTAEEVDLEASGLLPGTPVAAPALPDGPRTGLGVSPRLQDATAGGSGESTMRITDADVAHVTPLEAEEEATAAAGNQAVVDQGPFPLAELRHKKIGERINVTGTVTNNSEERVDSLSIRVAVKDAGGVTLGQGSTELRRSLGPGGSSPFSIVILGVAGEVHGVEGVARPSGRTAAVRAPEPSQSAEPSRNE